MISRIFFIHRLARQSKANMQALVCVCVFVSVWIWPLLCICNGAGEWANDRAQLLSLGRLLWQQHHHTTIDYNSEGHWKKCKWLWQKLQPHYQNVRSILSPIVVRANQDIDSVSTEIRFNCFPPNFSDVCFSLANFHKTIFAWDNAICRANLFRLNWVIFMYCQTNYYAML